MAAVVGYLLASTVAIVVTLALAGPRWTVQRDPTFELHDVAGRLVGVMSALAGFSATGLVFLVTQSSNVADPTDLAFTTVLTMFVVAYMGYFSSSLLFANISHRVDRATFDLAAAQYAGAAITLFSLFFGWFALRPLFLTFGLTTAADLVSFMLVGAVIVGYGLLAAALFRTGYVSARMTAILPTVAVVVIAAYAMLVRVAFPELRSEEATLGLTLVAFAAGVVAYTALTLLPIAARHDRAAAILAARWHLAIIGYAQGAVVLIGFLLLAVLGIA